MKLMLRPEWKPRPVGSFLGYLDLKVGVTIALLFALLNKVAGVYGLIAVLTGAGGSFAQLSLYIYSVLGLVVLVWGLRAVVEEDARRSLYLAHLFFADHVLSTLWTLFFAVTWWVYTPHDGQRKASSAAQEDIIRNAASHARPMSDEQRTEAALLIWNKEKSFAAIVIALGWFIKIYFALLVYSYAIHLRRGSYRGLPRSRPEPAGAPTYAPLGDDDLDVEIEDFYRVPVGSRTPGAGNSISSFADISNAKGRERRASANRNGEGAGGEVLFDEGDIGAGASSSGSGSSAASGDDEAGQAGHDRSRSARGAWMAPTPRVA